MLNIASRFYFGKKINMPGISRAFIDVAGGTILGDATNVRANGFPVALLMGPVAGHGRNEHSGPVLIGGSFSVRANGLPVIRIGDAASCGHPVTGSGNVRAG